MANENTNEGLRHAFDSWSNALNDGNLDSFYGVFDNDAEVLDEDFPWRMTKEEFIDHISFHAGSGDREPLWEHFKWIPRDIITKVWDNTGHVSGFSTFRGKPKDAGFRQRFMGFTTSWYFRDGKWWLVSWHQSPLLGRITGASPT